MPGELVKPWWLVAHRSGLLFRVSCKLCSQCCCSPYLLGPLCSLSLCPSPLSIRLVPRLSPSSIPSLGSSFVVHHLHPQAFGSRVAHSSGVTQVHFGAHWPNLSRRPMAACEATSAARRRRERRQRSWWRHEQLSVALALSVARHHSAPLGVGPVSYQALRGQRTDRAREEVVNETYYVLRHQTTPPPGERPGILLEPAPQRSDRSLRRFAGDCLPTPSLPVLAGASGEAVDAGALAFFVRRAVEEQEKAEEAMRLALVQEEEEKKLKEKELVVVPGAGQWVPAVDPHTGKTYFYNLQSHATSWTLPPGSSSSSSSGRKRKKKKRRRRWRWRATWT